MSGCTQWSDFFWGCLRFFSDIDRGTSGGNFENYAEGPFTLGTISRHNWSWEWVTKKWTGRGQTGLRAWVRNRGRLENRGHMVPKTKFQDGGDRTLDINSQNYHIGLVYDMIYESLEAKNYKFGMFCQQCHPSMASGDADLRPRNASRIHTWHLFTS